MVKNLLIAALAVALVLSLAVPRQEEERDSPAVPVEVPAVPVLVPAAPMEVPDLPGEDSAALVAALPPAPPVSEAELVDPATLVAQEPETHPLVRAVEAALDEGEALPGMAGAVLGFCLLDPGGEPLCERGSGLALIPASSLKTLTTATALEVLGAGFRFQTRLGRSAPVEGAGGPGGDLIVLGGGDPMLSLADIKGWAGQLAEAGLRSIPGRILGDGRLFPGSSFADFWDWGDIGNGYGSPVSGLNLEHNRFTATFLPGEMEGAPAQFLGASPAVPAVFWWNEVRTAPAGSGDGVTIYGGERAAVIHLRGTVPRGGQFRVAGAVPDPERFAAHHLRRALLDAGIAVAGESLGAGDLFLRGETVPEISEELLVHESPRLQGIVASIHATSDNHEAECLYQTLGLRAGLPPDLALRRHWEQRGLDLAGLRIVDGSGLARANHITSRTLAQLQHLAASGPAGESYLGSFSVTGGGKIRYKAGAMSAVRTCAGLVETERGWLAFALMLNHYASGVEAGELQQAVLEALLTPGEEIASP